MLPVRSDGDFVKSLKSQLEKLLEQRNWGHRILKRNQDIASL